MAICCLSFVTSASRVLFLDSSCWSRSLARVITRDFEGRVRAWRVLVVGLLRSAFWELTICRGLEKVKAQVCDFVIETFAVI
jgi:hypothetical protein